MAKRKQYTEEFRRDAVRLMMARGSRTVPEIAAEIGVSTSQLYRWHRDYAEKLEGGAVHSQKKREDVEEMRRRLRQLEQENALLKKAAMNSTGQRNTNRQTKGVAKADESTKELLCRRATRIVGSLEGG